MRRRGFHRDNGSEFINYSVVRLLDKLRIEQTKSRAHHCGDNGLVEVDEESVQLAIRGLCPGFYPFC